MGVGSITPIPDTEFEERLKIIREKMEQESPPIDALLIVGDEFNQANVRYVSDYNPVLEYAGVIIPLEEEPVLLAGPECEALARIRSKIRKIWICSDLMIPGEEYPNTPMACLSEIINEIDKKSMLKKWGVVGLAKLPTFIYRRIEEVLGIENIVDASHILGNMRAIKSRNEINLICEAYRIASKGLSKAVETAKIGVEEFMVAAEAMYAMQMEGPEKLSHVLQISSGKESVSALNRPSHKIIQDGEFVIVDLGAVCEGYYSDSGRTLVIGKGKRELLKIRDVANKAMDAAISKMKPGVGGWEVDKAARDIVVDFGYGKHMIYATAHSVGLQHCEEPMCQPSDNGLILREGMVFAVDIGLFNFPFGGVRIEEGVIITESEPKIITQIDRIL